LRETSARGVTQARDKSNARNVPLSSHNQAQVGQVRTKRRFRNGFNEARDQIRGALAPWKSAVANLETSVRSPIIETSIALSIPARDLQRSRVLCIKSAPRLKFTTPVALIEFRETSGVNSAGSDSPPAANDRIGFGSAFPTFRFLAQISANHVAHRATRACSFRLIDPIAYMYVYT